MYWGFDGEVNVSIKDTSDDPIPTGAGGYHVEVFNRAGENVTSYLTINKYNGYCRINSSAWGLSSGSAIGQNGSWTVNIWVDKNSDKTHENKQWTEEWNGSIKFKVQKAPGLQFKWIDDDGAYFTDDNFDAVIPKIPPIANVPLNVKFQIIGNDHTNFGDGGAGYVTRAMENITISGNSLFTGKLNTIPGVSYSSPTWTVPIIPTMSQNGGTITISGTWKTTSKTYGTFSEELDVGGTKFSTNGSVVTVTPSMFEIGNDQTLTVHVKSSNNLAYPWANVGLYYIGDQDGGTNGQPIYSHLVSDQIGGTADGKYELEFNTTMQTTNQTKSGCAGFTDQRAPRNLTIYVSAYNAGYGYALVQMKPKSNLKVEVFPETMLAGYEYDMFYINTSVVTTGNTTELPYKDDYDELTIRILDEDGKVVTDSIGASFTNAQINADSEIGKDYVVDIPNAYIKKGGTYTVNVFNHTCNSNGNNATLVVKQAKVTVDKTPLIWRSDDNISVTFTVTDEITGELLNGSLRIDNITWDVDYNKTWTNCSFDGTVDQGGNQSIEVSEAEGFVNGRITIQDITPNFLDPEVSYQDITFWFQPELADGGLGEFARAKGRLPISVPTITTDKKYISVGRENTIILTTTGRGIPIPNVWVRIHGEGILANSTAGVSDDEGNVVFSIKPTATGNISIDVGEQGRTIDEVIMVTSGCLISAQMQWM
jgi:hypothetical protein